MTDRKPQALAPGAILGVLMILIGMVLVLDKLNFLQQVTQFWPVVLIGGGMALLLEHFDPPPVL